MVLTSQHEDQMANFYSKKSTSKLLVWSLTFKKCCEDSNNEEISFNLHLANSDSQICCANIAIVGNFCSFVGHHIKAHLQVFASTW